MERNLGNGLVTWHQATPFHQPRRSCCFLYRITYAPCPLQLAEERVGEPWLVDSLRELRPLCSQHGLKFLCTWPRGEFKGHQDNEGQQSQRLVADRCLDHLEALSKGTCGNTAEVVIQLFQMQLSLQLPMLNPELLATPLGVAGMAVPGTACLLAKDNPAISPSFFLSLPGACTTLTTSPKNQLNCLSSKHIE